LLGSFLQKQISNDDSEKQRIMSQLNQYLTENRDRQLFDLPLLEEKRMKQLYDVFYIAQNQPLAQAEKVLKPETIVYIRQAEEISVHGCYVLDRWATYQPTELKQLEEQGDLILLIPVCPTATSRTRYFK
jgi:hypothetical protein